MALTLQEYLPLGRFSDSEAANFSELKAELRSSIQKGIDFVNKGALCSWHICILVFMWHLPEGKMIAS